MAKSVFEINVGVWSKFLAKQNQLPPALTENFAAYLIRFGLIKTPINESIKDPKNPVKKDSKSKTNFKSKIEKKKLNSRFLIFALLVAMAIKHVINLLLPDDSGRILIFIGDGVYLLPGKRYLYNLPINIFAWISTGIMLLFFWTNSTERRTRRYLDSWLKIFVFLNENKPLSQCSPYYRKLVVKMTKRCRLVFTTCQHMINGPPILTTLTWILVPGLHQDLWDYLIWGIPWTILYGAIWTYFTAAVIIYPFAYFHCLCYYFKLKLFNLNSRIFQLRNQQYLARNLCHVIDEYHRVLIQIDDTNRFWRYFIAIMYFSHIPLNCLLLNQLIFAAVKDEIVTVLMLTLFQESIAVLIAVSFSAGMVNAEAKKCFVTLNSVLTKEKNVRLKLKIQSLVERLSRPVGFTCHKLFVMDHYGFYQLVAKFGIFFLLIRQLENDV